MRPVRLIRGGFVGIQGPESLLGAAVLLRSGEARIDRSVRRRAADPESGEGPRLLVGGSIPIGTWTLEFPDRPGTKPVEAVVRPGETTDVTVEAAAPPR